MCRKCRFICLYASVCTYIFLWIEMLSWMRAYISVLYLFSKAVSRWLNLQSTKYYYIMSHTHTLIKMNKKIRMLQILWWNEVDFFYRCVLPLSSRFEQNDMQIIIRFRIIKANVHHFQMRKKKCCVENVSHSEWE